MLEREAPRGWTAGVKLAGLALVVMGVAYAGTPQRMLSAFRTQATLDRAETTSEPSGFLFASDDDGSSCWMDAPKGHHQTYDAHSGVKAVLLKSHPHSTAAFVEGLFVGQSGSYWESYGLTGQSGVHRVLLDGTEQANYVFMSAEEQKLFGEGIVPWGDSLFWLTWKAERGFIFDTSGGDIKRTGDFKYETTTGEGWGITTDGTSLIVSDGSSYLHFWDPESLPEGQARQTHRVQVKLDGRPVTQLNELEYVCGEVLANSWHSEKIYRINPKTGVVKGWFDLTGLHQHPRESCLNGIAYDAGRKVLYITGKKWDTLFEFTFTGWEGASDVDSQALGFA